MSLFPDMINNQIKSSSSNLDANIYLDILRSISQSLASTYRQTGPKVYSDNYLESVGGSVNPDSDIGVHRLKVYYNLSPAELYEHALISGSAIITNSGALSVNSGIKTGRSPKDKRIVKDSQTENNVWWDTVNFPMDSDSFIINRETATNYLNSRNCVYVFDGYAGWDKKYRQKIRVISTKPYHVLFMYNMLIKPTVSELLEPIDFTIYNAGEFPCNRFTGYMSSSTSIDISFTRKEVVILGTQYAGEMKKGIFSVIHYLMPPLNVLSLHSSANVANDDESNVCIFFGLSGTGKTTLSTVESRQLIGDDEHCWTDEGIFNIEGGCYAKCIGLDPEKEKEIYQAIKFGTLLENVKINPDRSIDFNSSQITQNTRASYPIEYIVNSKIPCVAGHPKNIILLTCDATGIFPLVSKLTSNQGMYHFISGYTSKTAGTEIGIQSPEATFSSCFGEAFLTRHPMVYAKMLKEKIDKYKSNIWLINTGWIGGGFLDKEFGSRRVPLKITRQIVEAIHQGLLIDNLDIQYQKMDVFGLEFPNKIPSIKNNQNNRNNYPNEIGDEYLNPVKSWINNFGESGYDRWMKSVNELADKFIENIKRFKLDEMNDILEGSPIKIDLK